MTDSQRKMKKTLRALKHQHNKRLQALRKKHEAALKKIKNKEEARIKELENAITDENREEVRDRINQYRRDVAEEVARIDEMSAQKIAELQEDYELAKRERQEEKRARQEAEREAEAHRQHAERVKREADAQADNLRREAEHHQRKRDQAVQRAQQEEEARHDREDQLAEVKAALKKQRKEYQDNMEDLENSLKVSKEHLQANYEMISKLKTDTDDLRREKEELAKELRAQRSNIAQCQTQKKVLQDRVEAFQIDSKTYQQQAAEIRRHEQKHLQDAANTTDALESRNEMIRQHKEALKQAQQDNQHEKMRHLKLRRDYQDSVDRVESLNSALDQCRQKNTSANQVLEDMRDRYSKLRKKHDKMSEEMERLVTSNDSYQQDLKREHRKLAETEQALKQSRDEMEEALSRAKSDEQKAYQLLDVCQQKGGSCLAQGKKRDEYVAHLESEIKRAMKVLKDDAALRRKAKRMEDTMEVKNREIKLLQNQLSELKQRNSEMKHEIDLFDDHREQDRAMTRQHGKLKDQHARALEWMAEMKSHHKQLHEQKKDLQGSLKGVSQKLVDSEARMQGVAVEMQKRDCQVKSLEKRISKCLYPGEKDRLEKELMDVIAENQKLQARMDEEVGNHQSLNTSYQDLKRQNADLEVLVEKLERDKRQMSEVVEQGAELNTSLVKTRQLLDKKDKQLELMSNQLAALINRNQTLEAREKKLEETLSYSTSPEETEVLNSKLRSCRMERKQAAVKLDTLGQISEKLREQQRVNEDKVRTMMEVIREGEDLKKDLMAERETRNRLEEALHECAANRKIESQNLMEKMREVEHRFELNRSEHERMMHESRERIKELQRKLERAADIEHQSRVRARLRGDNVIGVTEVVVPVSSASRRQVVTEEVVPDVTAADEPSLTHLSEPHIEMELRQLRREVDQLKQHEQRHGPSAELAVKVAGMPSMRRVQEIHALHEEALRAKEREMMELRERPYDEMLRILRQAEAPDSGYNSNQLYKQLESIQKRGDQRERKAYQDMLLLRAIHQKLHTEYMQARGLQGEMLDRANVGHRDLILQRLAAQAPPNQLMQEVDRYHQLVSAQQNYIGAQRDDATQQLRMQQQYISELERQVPKMNAVVQQMNVQKFPSLLPLKNRINQTKRIVIGGLDQEVQEARGVARSRSVLESQIDALSASARGVTAELNNLSRKRVPENLKSAQRFVQTSPGQIHQAAIDQKQLQDRSAIRSTAIIQPRNQAALGPPGRRLKADLSTGELSVRPFGTKPGVPDKRFFFNQVSLFGEPQKVFAPTVARAKDQVQQGESLVVITYSFDPPQSRNAKGDSVKYLVFLHAVEKVFPKIQALSGNGQLDVQLVNILPGNQRQDLVNPSHTLSQGCKYKTCNGAKQRFSNVTDVMSLMNDVRQKIDTSANAENHLVMSLSLPGSPSQIHIVDVLYNNVPQADQIKLMDSSWIDYLSDVIQEPNFKFDMFFNVLPFADDDKSTAAANLRLMQVSRHLEQFLQRVHNKGG